VKIMYMKKTIAGLIITGMIAITALAQLNVTPEWTGPTGSWEGVVTSVNGGPPPFRVLMTFTADGGFIGSGDGDSSVNQSGSPQYGVWERIGGKASRRYAVTFRQLYYAPDATSMGSATIRQTVVLNESGDTWEGPAEVKIFAPDGTLVFTGASVATATRIRSNPLP
jgi:hypothetical protein